MDNLTGGIKMSRNGTENSSDGSDRLSTVEIILTVGYIIIFATAVVGNSLVMAIIRRNSSGRMRSVSSYFIYSMASSDLVMAVGNLPERIIRSITGDIWLVDGVPGIILCKGVNFIEKMAIIVSISNLTAIALDRFLNVFFPHRKIITTKRCFVIIAFIWSLSAMYCSPILYYANLITKNEQLLCKTRTLFPNYSTWFFPFLLILISSLFIVVFLYAAICIKLWRRKVPGSESSASGATNKTPTGRVNRKVLKMVTAVVIVFYICFLPYWISWIFCSYPYSPVLCNKVYTTIAVFLSYINISLNPIIYVSLSGQFRDGAKLLCKKGGKVAPLAARTQTILAGIGINALSTPNNIALVRERDEDTELQNGNCVNVICKKGGKLSPLAAQTHTVLAGISANSPSAPNNTEYVHERDEDTELQNCDCTASSKSTVRRVRQNKYSPQMIKIAE